MAKLTTQPTNPNFLFDTNARFTLMRAPNLTFYAQQINLPGMSIEIAEQGSPFGHIYRHGTKMDFEDLELTFIVDEDMETYFEIYNWIIGLGFPDSYDDFTALNANPISSGKGIYSDATLTIMSSAKNPNLEVTFTDIFPSSLSPLQFDQSSDAQRMHCTATFKYQRFFLKKI